MEHGGSNSYLYSCINWWDMGALRDKMICPRPHSTSVAGLERTRLTSHCPEPGLLWTLETPWSGKFGWLIHVLAVKLTSQLLQIWKKNNILACFSLGSRSLPGAAEPLYVMTPHFLLAGGLRGDFFLRINVHLFLLLIFPFLRCLFKLNSESNRKNTNVLKAASSSWQHLALQCHF